MNKFTSLSILFCLAQCLWMAQAKYEHVPFKDYKTIYQPSKGRNLTFVHSPELNFVNAVAACASRGAVLAEFKDDEDILFLNEALKNGTMPNFVGPDFDYIYVGGMYVGPSDGDGYGTAPKVYQWFESGSNVTIWGPELPRKLAENGKFDASCLVAYPAWQTEKWAIGDVTCTFERPFICAHLDEL